MPALYDHPALRLPYVAVARWPVVDLDSSGQQDWVGSILQVENWLESCVGPHYAEWCWNTWSLHSNNLCSVSFRLERNCTLFLLKYPAV